MLNENLKKANQELEKAKESLEEKVEERTKELTLSKDKYRRIISDSFDPIITLDDKLVITGWNKGAELILDILKKK